MDYRYYIWSSYGWVLFGLGGLLWNTLAQSKRLRQELQNKMSPQVQRS